MPGRTTSDGGSVEFRGAGGAGGVIGRGGNTGAADGKGAGGVTGPPAAGPAPMGRSPGEDAIVGRSGEPGLVADRIWLGLAAPGT